LRDRVRSIVVIEPSEPLARRGHERNPRVGFAVGDGRALPVRDASADRVLLIEVLHHVDDATAVLREALRVLRPGGSILVEESEFQGPLGRVRLWAERAFLEGVWPRSRPELLGWLSALGLHGEVLEHEGFVIVARRG
jgi:ubiquinone/menaquinone biosynthesis C-methylase UbiE